MKLIWCSVLIVFGLGIYCANGDTWYTDDFLHNLRKYYVSVSIDLMGRACQDTAGFLTFAGSELNKEEYLEKYTDLFKERGYTKEFRFFHLGEQPDISQAGNVSSLSTFYSIKAPMVHSNDRVNFIATNMIDAIELRGDGDVIIYAYQVLGGGECLRVEEQFVGRKDLYNMLHSAVSENILSSADDCILVPWLMEDLDFVVSCEGEDMRFRLVRKCAKCNSTKKQVIISQPYIRENQEVRIEMTVIQPLSVCTTLYEGKIVVFKEKIQWEKCKTLNLPAYRRHADYD
jgi:hypothetical protein